MGRALFCPIFYENGIFWLIKYYFTAFKGYNRLLLIQNSIKKSKTEVDCIERKKSMKIKAVIISVLIINSIFLSGCGNSSMEENAPSTFDGGTAADREKNFSDGGQGAESFGEGFSRIVVSACGTDNTLIGWGLGKDKDSLNRPIDAVKAQEKYGKYSSLFIDPSGEKTVYLTFDEGYENGYTSQILDILKETGVKAAFFVTLDYCKSSSDLVRRMISEGHIVGNHSCTHPSFPKCSAEQVKEEITKLHDYVKDNFGYEMTLFRFPMGEFSESTLKQVRDLGYISVFWSFAHRDWDPKNQPSLEQAFNVITSSLHNGEIYLLHAVSEANTNCLKDVISFWRTEGYTVGDLRDIAS